MFKAWGDDNSEVETDLLFYLGNLGVWWIVNECVEETSSLKFDILI